MIRMKTYNRRNLCIVLIVILFGTCALVGRLGYLMIAQADHYGVMAKEVQQRERPIKASRGNILDRNGMVIASNKPVCTISVIHSQITDPETVIQVLSDKLEMKEETIRKRVEKVSSIERIKTNVEKELADEIRKYDMDGVMIDEDYKRYYPYDTLASKVIGFTGSDNQGIIGLEIAYDKYLQGMDGTILTLTTAKGVEIEGAAEDRIEPIPGNDLYISLDVNIQKYAEQAAKRVLEAKEAKRVSVIVMNPQNGEIYAMVNIPEFNLNEPFKLVTGLETDENAKNETDLNVLNNMWRNPCISDTYEPGSVFKIVTATAALEEGAVRLTDNFYCPGYKVVEDRRIRCHKAGGHGAEDFVQGIQNSCNPVFMEVGARVGAEAMYQYYRKLGLFEKTRIDLPGEANSIMHKLDDIGAVELATMSFGQSFQITPLQLLRAVSSIVNGGYAITPHFGVKVVNEETSTITRLKYDTKNEVVSKQTSDMMKQLLESVVAEGSGKRAYIEGFRIGGKTATSEKLPRRSKKYISSFLGIAPADNPQVLGLIMIDEPVGIYYGGTIAAPVIAEIFDNILPYLGVEKKITESDKKEE